MKISALFRITGYLLTAIAALQLANQAKAIVPGAKPQNPKASANAAAAKGNQGNPDVIPPGSHFRGRTYGEWSAKWWQGGLGLDNTQSPIATNGLADCSNGQTGNVWFLIGTFIPAPSQINCRVPHGTALFFPIVNAECSNLEDPPFFGLTPAERETCAKAFVNQVTSMTATIDGTPIENLANYRVQSGDFEFTLPANNLLGKPAGTVGRSGADGYYLLLNPLSSGQHTIHFTATFCCGFGAIETNYVITVGN